MTRPVADTTLSPECGGRVVEMRPLDPAVADRRARQPLVEACQNLGGAFDRSDEGFEREGTERDDISPNCSIHCEDGQALSTDEQAQDGNRW